MHELVDAFATAFALLVHLDPDLVEIIGLSLRVSLSALALALGIVLLLLSLAVNTTAAVAHGVARNVEGWPGGALLRRARSFPSSSMG